MKQLSLALSLLLFSTAGQAELYKWVDEEGNTHYSDSPTTSKAKPFTPPGITTTPAVKVPPQAPKAVVPQPAAFKYNDIKIVSPGQDATIRSNPGNITIAFESVPALNTDQGHSISVAIDGTPVKDNITTSSVQLNNIDRGTHTVTVTINDETGKPLITSSGITFHMHRVSILHKKPAP